ncbi:hypervirulence associated TUDOR domain-containing protein [Roseicella frigidaeris]|uniref:DUF2945 domain-containing protein n=1 Tax=Roseicella frigidaeris TaxID=2230885 RepID=A0A327M782_9PROT|nr:DUF2945 domain-containing protein [Roseicella frigidaeris]RAI58609.1 DUF2945 domain-containing protein [Roseicella frigidaeris]
MAAKPKTGDKVTWDTSQGRAEGVVEKTVTRTTRIKGHVAKATQDEPQVVVKSTTSGKRAVHKPEALKKA